MQFRRENEVILSMITDGEKWHYFAVKNHHVLLRGKTSKLNDDSYCMDCLYLF